MQDYTGAVHQREVGHLQVADVSITFLKVFLGMTFEKINTKFLYIASRILIQNEQYFLQKFSADSALPVNIKRCGHLQVP